MNIGGLGQFAEVAWIRGEDVISGLVLTSHLRQPAPPDLATRLTRAPFVTIAEIYGRARGLGSECALACDLRFASRGRARCGGTMR